MLGKLYVDFTEDVKPSPSKSEKDKKKTVDPIRICKKYRDGVLPKNDEYKLPTNVHEPHEKVRGDLFVDFTDGAVDMYDFSPTRSSGMRSEQYYSPSPVRVERINKPTKPKE